MTTPKSQGWKMPCLLSCIFNSSRSAVAGRSFLTHQGVFYFEGYLCAAIKSKVYFKIKRLMVTKTCIFLHSDFAALARFWSVRNWIKFLF